MSRHLLLSACVLVSALGSALADPAVTKSAIAKLNAGPTAVPAPAVIQAASQPITFKLAADKASYRNGEVVRLTLSTPKAGHLRLFYKDAGGEVACLFPSDALLAEAARTGAHVTDTVSAGKNIIISGFGSATGVELVIGPPKYGAEEVAVVITDVPVQEDGPIIAQLKLVSSATDAARLIAGLAIRQDAVTKSAIGHVNKQGVPTTLAAVGIQSVGIATAP